MYEPLKVTAYLRTGIVCDRWLPLDGVILYAAVRDALGGPPEASVPKGAIRPIGSEVHVPLKIVNANHDDWFYACSWAYPQPWWVAEGVSYWHKRVDEYYASLFLSPNERRTKVHLSEGPTRSYRMLTYYYVADRIEWYCVGDGDRISDLLSCVTHLGKKRAYGWGRVRRWEVERVGEDWSVWGPNGELMRGVPATYWMRKNNGAPPPRMVYYGIRPPYYLRGNQTMVVMPDEAK